MRVSGIVTGLGAVVTRGPKEVAGSLISDSNSLVMGCRPYGSGQALKQRPQALQASRSSITGANPVAGSISTPNVMHSLGHASMQRPQALQYSGRT